MRPAQGRAAQLGVTLAMALALVACGPGSDPGIPAGSSPAAPISPVIGQLTKLDSDGLTKVRGFRLRTDDGTEMAFTVGVLENGAQFPPGHLAEHMATSSPVRVFFRDEGGTLVVYRIEDAP